MSVVLIPMFVSSKIGEMPATIKRSPLVQNRFDWSLQHAIMIPFILFIIAAIFKVLDVFMFRLDESLGEIILSKSLGFLLVLGYL